MSASIVSRTISTLVDKKIVLSNDYAARQMSIGTSWTKLRVGMRWAINTNGLTTQFNEFPFFFGLCSSAGDPVGGTTPKNCFGVTGLTGTYFPYTAGPPPCVTNIWLDMVKYVNGTKTYKGSYIANGPEWPADYNARREVFIVEITKGSPDWTAQTVHTGSNGPDVSYAQLLNAMEAADLDAAKSNLNVDLGGSYYSKSTAGTLAFDETAGDIDTVNMMWGLTSRTLEISEAVYCRIA